MAKKKVKTKPKITATPYNPTGVTQYPSEAAFNTAVSTRAKSQLQPTLNDIRTRRKQEFGANTTRNNDIQRYYGYDLAARQSAQTRQQAALQGLLDSVGVANTDAQTGLSSALRPAADANSAAATQLGVAPTGTDPALTNVLASYGQANKMGLAGDYGAYNTNAANDIALTGVQEREAGTTEMNTHAAAMRALDKERTDAMGQLPGLTDTARSGLLQELLANSQNKLAWNQFGETRRSNKAGESIAGDQQTLAENQFDETKKQNKAQNKLNEEQLQISRDELDSKIDQAQTDQEMTVAQDNAKKFDTAAQWLQGWLAPTDAEQSVTVNKDTKAKKTKIRKSYDTRIKNGFHSTLVQLMTQFGLDRATAYEVMRSAPPYRKKAEQFADAWNMRSYPH